MRNLFAVLLLIFIFPSFAFGQANSKDLIFAARSSDTKAVLAALRKGADVNTYDKDGHTALMYSMMYGGAKIEIVDALLRHGADVNARANDGMTALMLAAGAGSGGIGVGVEVVRLLLDKGANPNLKTSSGHTALMAAVHSGSPEVVQALLRKGADVNARDDNTGVTALMIASRSGHTEIVKILLDKGADLSAEDEDGMTALGLATDKGYAEIMKILKAKKAPLPDKKKWRKYNNLRYRYTIDYPLGIHIASEERDPKNGHRVSKALNDVSSIIIVLPAISYPTDQGAPKLVMVQASLAMRVDALANPSRLTVEEWLHARPENPWVTSTEKISLHDQTAIKLKKSDGGGGSETCVYVGSEDYIYQICFSDADPEAPQFLQESMRQTFEQMLQSFKMMVP